jgi:cytochrome c-type biogenesis protein CcmH/NrfG
MKWLKVNSQYKGFVAVLTGIILFYSNPFLEASPELSQGQILSREGSVDYSAESSNWTPAKIGQALMVKDRLRTLTQSRAMLQLAELGRLRVNELTTLEVLPPRDNSSKATVDLKTGAIYFFTRDKPREFQIQTPYALAASRGTEFSVTVDADGTSHYDVFDGEVGVTNELGGVLLAPGESGEAQPGKAPFKTAVIQSHNIIQWWLYYPGVIDLRDLPLTAQEQTDLAGSLESYRAGDLLGALNDYPTSRLSQSDAEKIYHAALLLSVGQVTRSASELPSGNESAAATALRQVIAATASRTNIQTAPPKTASEWLAYSYFQQSSYDLAGALQSARQSILISPEFGFGWERVAELEFSFGRIGAAKSALDSALKFSPRNAQAWALRGFIEAAQQHIPQARAAFQNAIDLDPALGNAWLGRGLVRLRQGEATEGKSDLQTAAALEPNRSVLRSYLGKGFDQQKDDKNAERELTLAKKLDAADPTPWLYSALVLRQQLRFNEAVDELEHSIALNDNRRVYRSKMLLDQDRAVRSSSLATIYQNAGLDEVSVREAAQAVNYDYANYSAHLFLSDSFNALRDPTDFNLRYDTPWLNELLLANLLAPPGAGTLSRNVSQHEYSKLFESDRFGLSTETEYNSLGQFKEIASQFASHGGTSYSLDLDYRHNDGVRPNNDLSRIEWFSQIKQQITAKDSVMAFIEYRDYDAGDNFQYYDPAASARPDFRYTEEQKPNVLAGFRHEWTPDIHTLILGGWLQNDQRFGDKNTSQLILTTNSSGVSSASSLPFDINQMTRFEVWTVELNQIFQDDHQRLIAGGKFQSGDFHTVDEVLLSAGSTGFQSFFNNPPAALNVHDRFDRYAAYAYYTRELFPNFSLTAGLSYERMTYPENFRSPPAAEGSTTRQQFNPKAALVWTPFKEVTLRSIYSRGLGGVSYDQSYRLEPTELAGFVQSFGSTIPESVVGSLSAPDCEIIGGAVDVKLKTRTYFGVQVEALNVSADQQQGVFNFGGTPPILPGGTRETLDFSETTVSATVNQLLSDEWSVGLTYRFCDASLHTIFPAIALVNASANRIESASLHQATAYVIYNYSSGFFARAENRWYHQDNAGYTPPLGPEDFCQQNLWLGWRFKRQRAEIAFGLLNISDQDYNLNPLTLFNEVPRERTYVGRVKFNF